MKRRCINFLLRLPSALAMRARINWLRLLGMRIGSRCWVQNITVPRNPWDIELETGTAIDRHVNLLALGESTDEPKILIRSGTYINHFTMLAAAERVEIGHRCLIGPHCYITDSDHGLLPDTPIPDQPMTTDPVRIGDEVWIGAGAVVLKGVSIGKGAVVGAGAVVTRSVDPWAIVAGVPAKVIAWRTSSAVKPV